MTRRVEVTRRGWSLIGAAAGLVVGSYLLGAVELLALAVVAVAVVAGGAAWLAFGSGVDLAMTRRVRPPRLQVGGEGRIDLTMSVLPVAIAGATGRMGSLVARPPCP